MPEGPEIFIQYKKLSREISSSRRLENIENLTSKKIHGYDDLLPLF